MTAVSRPGIALVGSRDDRFEAAVSLAGAAAVCGLFWLVEDAMGTRPPRLELVAVVTSLSSMWLARRENVWAMSIGVVSSVFAAMFLFDADLVVQAWVQLLVFLPLHMVGWMVWCRPSDGGGGLVPTRLTGRGVGVAAGAMVVCWLALWGAVRAVEPSVRFQAWDVSITAAAVVGLVLMVWKRTEHWLVWLVPVHLSAVLFHVATRTWAFVLVHGLFMVNAWSGWRLWVRRGRLTLS